MIHEATERIRQMEQCFDILQKESPAAIIENETLKEMLRVLTEYYEGGQWLQDYELDEKGIIPQDLKRGVLSQDAIYNFLEKMKDR